MKNFTVMIILPLMLLSCGKKETEPPKTETVKAAEITAGQITAESLIAESRNCTHEHKEGELCIDPVASKVANFSMEGKPEEAIKVLLIAKDIPEYQWDKAKMYESLIYLYDKTKQYEKNIDIWREGHEKGMIFKMDTTRTHFKPYLKLEGFTEVYNEDIEMQLNKEKEE